MIKCLPPQADQDFRESTMSKTSGHGNNKKTEQHNREEIQTVLLALFAKGIQDWEILDAWSALAHQQGNYAVADTLESAAYELGKPVD